MLIFLFLLFSCRLNKLNKSLKGPGDIVNITTSNQNGFAESLGVVRSYIGDNRNVENMRISKYEDGYCNFFNEEGSISGECLSNNGEVIKSKRKLIRPIYNTLSDFITLGDKKIAVIGIGFQELLLYIEFSSENKEISSEIVKLHLKEVSSTYSKSMNIFKVKEDTFGVIYSSTGGSLQLDKIRISGEKGNLSLVSSPISDSFSGGVERNFPIVFYTEGINLPNDILISLSFDANLEFSRSQFVGSQNLEDFAYRNETSLISLKGVSRGFGNIGVDEMKLGPRIIKNNKNEMFISYTSDNKKGYIRGVKYENGEIIEILPKTMVKESTYLAPLDILYLEELNLISISYVSEGVLYSRLIEFSNNSEVTLMEEIELDRGFEIKTEIYKAEDPRIQQVYALDETNLNRVIIKLVYLKYTQGLNNNNYSGHQISYSVERNTQNLSYQILNKDNYDNSKIFVNERDIEDIKIINFDSGESCVFMNLSNFIYKECHDKLGFLKLSAQELDVNAHVISDFIKFRDKNIALFDYSSRSLYAISFNVFEDVFVEEYITIPIRYNSIPGSLINIIHIDDDEFILLYVFNSYSLGLDRCKIEQGISNLSFKITRGATFGIKSSDLLNNKILPKGVLVQDRLFIVMDFPRKSISSFASYFNYKNEITLLISSSKSTSYYSRGIANFGLDGRNLGGRLSKNNRDEIFIAYTTDNKKGYVRGFVYLDGERKDFITETLIEESNYITPIRPLYIDELDLLSLTYVSEGNLYLKFFNLNVSNGKGTLEEIGEKIILDIGFQVKTAMFYVEDPKIQQIYVADGTDIRKGLLKIIYLKYSKGVNNNKYSAHELSIQIQDNSLLSRSRNLSAQIVDLVDYNSSKFFIGDRDVDAIRIVKYELDYICLFIRVSSEIYRECYVENDRSKSLVNQIGETSEFMSKFINLNEKQTALLHYKDGPYLYSTSLSNDKLLERYFKLSMTDYFKFINIIKTGNDRFFIIYKENDSLREVRAQAFFSSSLEIFEKIGDEEYLEINSYDSTDYSVDIEGISIDDYASALVSFPLIAPNSNASYFEYRNDIASLDFTFDENKEIDDFSREIANFEKAGIKLGGRITKNSRNEIFITYTSDNNRGYVMGFKYENGKRIEWIPETKVEESAYLTPIVPLYIEELDLLAITYVSESKLYTKILEVKETNRSTILKEVSDRVELDNEFEVKTNVYRVEDPRVQQIYFPNGNNKGTLKILYSKYTNEKNNDKYSSYEANLFINFPNKLNANKVENELMIGTAATLAGVTGLILTAVAYCKRWLCFSNFRKSHRVNISGSKLVEGIGTNNSPPMYEEIGLALEEDNLKAEYVDPVSSNRPSKEWNKDQYDFIELGELEESTTDSSEKYSNIGFNKNNERRTVLTRNKSGSDYVYSGGIVVETEKGDIVLEINIDNEKCLKYKFMEADDDITGFFNLEEDSLKEHSAILSKVFDNGKTKYVGEISLNLEELDLKLEISMRTNGIMKYKLIENRNLETSFSNNSKVARIEGVYMDPNDIIDPESKKRQEKIVNYEYMEELDLENVNMGTDNIKQGNINIEDSHYEGIRIEGSKDKGWDRSEYDFIELIGDFKVGNESEDDYLIIDPNEYDEESTSILIKKREGVGYVYAGEIVLKGKGGDIIIGIKLDDEGILKYKIRNKGWSNDNITGFENVEGTIEAEKGILLKKRDLLGDSFYEGGIPLKGRGVNVMLDIKIDNNGEIKYKIRYHSTKI